MIMNYISTDPEESNEDKFLLTRECERIWLKQSKSSPDLFNTIIESDPTIVDELPLLITELGIERSELENEVQGVLRELQGSDYFEEEVTTQFLIYPRIERLLVIDAAIMRMKTKWFEHYQKQLGIVHKRKGLSSTEIQLARNTSVLVVAERVGLQLQRVGARYRTCCPLHTEKTPSFTLFPGSNSWYCFGCHEGGDGIRLVRDVLGLSFIHAVKFIIS